MPTTYAERLKLPIEGSEEVVFSTPNGLKIARGYNRVLLTNKGPLVEFNDKQIVRENISIPPAQQWRVTHPATVHVEYRSKDYCHAKVLQFKKDAEEFKAGAWYVSPFDLISDQYPVLIQPLKRTRHYCG